MQVGGDKPLIAQVLPGFDSMWEEKVSIGRVSEDLRTKESQNSQ